MCSEHADVPEARCSSLHELACARSMCHRCGVEKVLDCITKIICQVSDVIENTSKRRHCLGAFQFDYISFGSFLWIIRNLLFLNQQLG